MIDYVKYMLISILQIVTLSLAYVLLKDIQVGYIIGVLIFDILASIFVLNSL